MWREVTIDGKVYLAGCTVTIDKVEFNLYNCDDCWSAMQTEEQMLQIVKKLNKRIHFDVATVRDTLQNTLPELVMWAETGEVVNRSGDAGNNGVERNELEGLERVLKLKYRAGEGAGRPFHYEWQLKKLSASETIRLPAAQVFSIVEALPAQVDELLEVLRRKENEIAGYRRECGDLKRSTLATSSFDIQQFRERFSESSIKANALAHMLERWQANVPVPRVELRSPHMNLSPARSIKQEDGTKISPTSSHTAIKESPRSRKRKALFEQKLQLSRKLNAAKHKVEYENSQSQSLSDSQEFVPIKEEEKPNLRSEADDGNLKLKRIKDEAERKSEVESKRRKSPRIQLRSSGRQNLKEHHIKDVAAVKPEARIVEQDAKDRNAADSKGIVAIGKILANNPGELTSICRNNRTNEPNEAESKSDSTNEINSYIDSVLKSMEEFDKQLQENLWNYT